MTPIFQLSHECALVERFVSTTSDPGATRYWLKTLCSSFRLLLPDQTPLNYSGRTDWIVPWRERAEKQYATQALYCRLTDFARMTRWLFHEGIIEDDAFAHVRVRHAFNGNESMLWLRYNLHRIIERYLPIACGTFTLGRRATVRSGLLDFNAFLNRSLNMPPPDTGALSVDLHLIAAWLRHRRVRLQARIVVEEGAGLHRFLKFAQQEGAIAGHAFTQLVRDYGRKGYRGIIEALLSADPDAALASVRCEPRFASGLGRFLQAFAEYKRSLGQSFRVQETILAHLDRYLRQLPKEQRLSASVLRMWIATTPNLRVQTRRRRWRVVRQFCRWMLLRDPSFFVPEPLDIPPTRQQDSSRRPFIYTVQQIQTLLKAASNLAPVGSLRPCTFRCLIGLLYGSGLRISEALGLNLGDFDAKQQILLIRETKFYKSRYVPLAPSVSASIVDYLCIRRTAGQVPLSPETPVFVSRHGRRCAYGAVSETFLALLRRCDLRGPPGLPGPRLHDIRHYTESRTMPSFFRLSFGNPPL